MRRIFNSPTCQHVNPQHRITRMTCLRMRTTCFNSLSLDRRLLLKALSTRIRWRLLNQAKVRIRTRGQKNKPIYPKGWQRRRRRKESRSRSRLRTLIRWPQSKYKLNSWQTLLAMSIYLPKMAVNQSKDIHPHLLLIVLSWKKNSILGWKTLSITRKSWCKNRTRLLAVKKAIKCCHWKGNVCSIRILLSLRQNCRRYTKQRALTRWTRESNVNRLPPRQSQRKRTKRCLNPMWLQICSRRLKKVKR